VDSRLRRSPPDRASAVSYGQAGENATRFPRLAHRSAAAHKLHSTPQQHRMNLISGSGETSSRLPIFSLFLPRSCPNNRDRRSGRIAQPHPAIVQHQPLHTACGKSEGESRKAAAETGETVVSNGIFQHRLVEQFDHVAASVCTGSTQSWSCLDWWTCPVNRSLRKFSSASKPRSRFPCALPCAYGRREDRWSICKRIEWLPKLP
jgi:hypothetical protein